MISLISWRFPIMLIAFFFAPLMEIDKFLAGAFIVVFMFDLFEMMKFLRSSE